MEQVQERRELSSRPRLDGRDEVETSVEAERAHPLNILRALILPIMALTLAAVALFGFLLWREHSLYVSTDNAIITGAMVQVTSPGAGQVRSVDVDIGDQVTQNQVLATLAVPNLVWVRAPFEGIVVARQSNPGDTVATGRSIVTVADPTQSWVQAQIEETQIGRVRPGQAAEVTIDAVGTTLQGRVVGVGRAASSSIQPQGNSQGSIARSRQLVPVKIDVDYGDLPIVVGGSVGVRIRVQD
jgi:multidrug resistance efflux pump